MFRFDDANENYISKTIILINTVAVSCRIFSLQLDWPGIAECAYADIFAVAARFRNQDHFWISHKKSGVVFYFFEKSKNELVRQKMMFFGNVSKNLMVLR